MKRRTFVTTLAALAATPALPATSLGASTQVTQHFAKAKLLARCHDRASPEMFARLMKLDAETAKGVYTLLKERNVIARGLDGITRAINPLNTHCVPNEALRARDYAQVAKEVSSRLCSMAKDRAEALTKTDPAQPKPDVTTPNKVLSDADKTASKALRDSAETQPDNTTNT